MLVVALCSSLFFVYIYFRLFYFKEGQISSFGAFFQVENAIVCNTVSLNILFLLLYFFLGRGTGG